MARRWLDSNHLYGYDLTTLRNVGTILPPILAETSLSAKRHAPKHIQNATHIRKCEFESNPLHIEKIDKFQLLVGGEGGIRTHVTVARKPHFECGAFDHSATSPARFGKAALCRKAAYSGSSRGHYLSAQPLPSRITAFFL